MKGCLSALFMAAAAWPTVAQPLYDRKLEQAVMEIVAAKIGDIRGGFAFGKRPMMVIVENGFIVGRIEMDPRETALDR